MITERIKEILQRALGDSKYRLSYYEYVRENNPPAYDQAIEEERLNIKELEEILNDNY